MTSSVKGYRRPTPDDMKALASLRVTKYVHEHGIGHVKAIDGVDHSIVDPLEATITAALDELIQYVSRDNLKVTGNV